MMSKLREVWALPANAPRACLGWGIFLNLGPIPGPHLKQPGSQALAHPLMNLLVRTLHVPRQESLIKLKK